MSGHYPGQRCLEQPISVGDWILPLFLASIPMVGFIMLLVWAFGGGANETKSNWAKATLLWMVLVFAMVMGFYILIFLLVGVASLSNQ